MANYLVTDAELTATAEAVRQKGGTSALIPWQAGTGFKAAVEAIPSGASLPSVISKIDGGSFTLASDTKCSLLDIATALNTPAKGFVIWCDELLDFETVSNKAIVSASVCLRTFASASDTYRYGYYAYLQRQTSGSTYNGATTLVYENQPPKFTGNNKINYYVSDTFYIADKTYYWLAWA